MNILLKITSRKMKIQSLTLEILKLIIHVKGIIFLKKMKNIVQIHEKKNFVNLEYIEKFSHSLNEVPCMHLEFECQHVENNPFPFMDFEFYDDEDNRDLENKYNKSKGDVEKSMKHLHYHMIENIVDFVFLEKGHPCPRNFWSDVGDPMFDKSSI